MSQAKTRKSRWFHVTDRSRRWEDFYRDRWSYDKTVRTSHGVNCSGSCSWEVFVKDGVICWELQKTDWPQINSETPNHEPRGCQRGISTSWYVYSPVRPKYPYVRGSLLDFYREERGKGKDPVDAFAAIVNDPVRAAAYKDDRGKAGWRRVSWDEATELASAGLIHTIKKWGPDRIAGFSPIPAMSMVSWCAGMRLTSLLGASINSFYEWYHDNPHCQPKNFGEQTDVHESADWYQSTYWLTMGTNLPMTRTPDAHFASEFKYKGGKIVVFSPNYSDVTKFSDTWIQLKAGTDAAILAAMNHVVIKEFFIDRQVPYFQEYVKQYTSLPFLLKLDKQGEHYVPGRLVRAADLSAHKGVENDEWKLVEMDTEGKTRLPNGTLGFRWEEEHSGKWNLEQKDSQTGEEFDPLLTLLGAEDARAMTKFPDFTGTFSVDVGKSDPHALVGESVREVPVKKLITDSGEEILVTTGFDLLCAHMGVPRGLAGEYPTDYDDATQTYTPAWQEQETGISREVTIRIAREWAENAEKTRGKSLIIAGPGATHWYHSDLYQRFGVLLGALTGCHGVNGGGWCHYVGTEKIRNVAAVVGTIGIARDWHQPSRMMNSTSYWYFHTDQWRYDGMKLDPIMVPWAKEMPKYNHSADMNAVAVRNGWLPFFPTLNKNPLEIIKDAEAAGHNTEKEIEQYVVQKIRDGELRFAIEDPDDPANFPRALMVWRGNLIGTSMRGHMLALRHLLGTHHNVTAEPDAAEGMIKEIEWRDGQAVPEGKLDLLINVELRMISTSNYSDILLPAAHWYEKSDITVTDLHTFIHPFSAAHDPAWETKTDWDAFKLIAEKFSQMSEKHFPEPIRDLVITPMGTDTPDEYAQPWGSIKDWKYDDVEMIPGKTMPRIQVVERDYKRTFEKYTTLGPNANKNFGVKGINFDISEIYDNLKDDHRVGTGENGMPSLEKDVQVAETILQLSPETNGEAAHMAWEALEKRTGLELSHIVEGERDQAFRYDDLIAQPRRVLTSPHWSGLEPPGRTYSPWTSNVEYLIPWRTLSGRIDLYHDHQVYQDLGEAFPVYKPPIDTTMTGVLDPTKIEKDSKIFRFLTPHGKWSIHSNFWDNLWMQRMFRGGQVIWLNPKDADEIDVKDNDWIEAYSETGIVVARACVSQQVSRDTAVMYHMSERTLNVPFSRLARDRKLKDLRGGNNNAPTRIQMNPSFMTGGYAQFSYGLNYWGTSPAERDMAIAIRKMPLDPDGKVIYREEQLKELKDKPAGGTR